MTKNKSARISYCLIPALDSLCIILCSKERAKFSSQWRQVEEGNGKWECHKKTSCKQIQLLSFWDVTVVHEEPYLSPSNCSPTCNDHVTQGGVSARRYHPCSIRQRVKPPPPTPDYIFLHVILPSYPTSLRCKCHRLFSSRLLLTNSFFLHLPPIFFSLF